jgi:hypothetical protein
MAAGKTCSAVSNEGFSLFFLFEQGSGPSIALAETGPGKAGMFGGNPRSSVGARSGSAPTNPPFIGA